MLLMPRAKSIKRGTHGGCRIKANVVTSSKTKKRKGATVSSSDGMDTGWRNGVAGAADRGCAVAATGGVAPRSRPEAMKQLKALAKTLTETTQGDGAAVVESVQALANDGLASHPDRNVRFWATKCLIEALRVFAPKFPLDPERLHALVKLLIEELDPLAKPSGNKYNCAVSLLERLVEIRGFLLIFECERHQELLAALIEMCLAASCASNCSHIDELLKKLLTVVLGEADEIATRSLELLVMALTPERQKSQNHIGLVRHVFASLANSGAALQINDFLHAALYGRLQPEVGRSTLAEVKERSHALLSAVLQLCLIDPALVVRVMPNLQADLSCATVDRRCIVTRIVGTMLAHFEAPGSAAAARPTLLLRHPALLDRFLERFGDADTTVRLAALDGAAALLRTAAANSGGAGGSERSKCAIALASAALKVRALLLEHCRDPDEQVRLCVINIAFDTVESWEGLELLSPVLPCLFRRMLDKKVAVREACIDRASRVYARHGLPAWVKGRREVAESVSWVPQLLCEAYSMFIGGRLGLTSKVEASIEQQILGIGGDYVASERALAFIGLFSCVSGHAAASKGFALMLERKRDANSSLRRFIRLRMMKDGGPGEAELAAALKALGRLSPAAEEPHYAPHHAPYGAYAASAGASALAAQLRGFDAVQEPKFWSELERISNPSAGETTTEMRPLLLALAEQVIEHRLGALTPLLKRALLSTWLLPDQALALLDVWGGRVQTEPSLAHTARQLAVVLAKYFPGAFLHHKEIIVNHLAGPDAEDICAALCVLGALGKHVASGQTLVSVGSPQAPVHDDFVKSILDALVIARDKSTCRKAVRALSLLPNDESWVAVNRVLRWAEELWSNEAKITDAAVSMGTVAACLERTSEIDGCPGSTKTLADPKAWIVAAHGVIQPNSAAPHHLRYAAIDLCAAAGAEDELSAMLSGTFRMDRDSSLHAMRRTLRALRRNFVSLTTRLLTQLAKQTYATLLGGLADADTERLLDALRKFQGPTAMHTKLSDRLRLCATLPTVFAVAPMKHQRDNAQRLLQATLATAARQSVARGEPLLDYAVACFIHFLTRLDVFVTEAASTAFPVSARISIFFVEALLRDEPLLSVSNAGIVLRVADRVRHFVDREDPCSDRVQRAACILRYAVENRCPKVSAELSSTQEDTTRGGLPAELFAIREVASASLTIASGDSVVVSAEPIAHSRSPSIDAEPAALGVVGSAVPPPAVHVLADSAAASPIPSHRPLDATLCSSDGVGFADAHAACANGALPPPSHEPSAPHAGITRGGELPSVGLDTGGGVVLPSTPPQRVSVLVPRRLTFGTSDAKRMSGADSRLPMSGIQEQVMSGGRSHVSSGAAAKRALSSTGGGRRATSSVGAKRRRRT